MKMWIIASQKGGVGKTTSAINLAVLAAAEARTLLIDADPNRSLRACLRLPRSSDPLNPAVLPGLDLLTASELGDDVPAEISRFLAASGGQYSTIIIDSPPYTGPRSDALYQLGGQLALVMKPDPLSFRTLPPYLEALTSNIRQSQSRFVGILLVSPNDANDAQQWEQSLRARFGAALLHPTIPYDPAAEAALVNGRPLCLHKPEASAALAYAKLAKEIGITGVHRQQH